MSKQAWGCALQVSVIANVVVVQMYHAHRKLLANAVACRSVLPGPCALLSIHLVCNWCVLAEIDMSVREGSQNKPTFGTLDDDVSARIWSQLDTRTPPHTLQ